MSADWQSIQRELEQGLGTQSSLAVKYGITQQAISKRAIKEGWVVPPLGIVVSTTTNEPPPVDNEPSLVDQALADLAIHLTGDPKEAKLQLNQHKLFADSFSQYMKAKMLSEQEQEQELPKGIDWSMFTQEELAIIQPIFAQAEERQRGQQENITAIRRVG